MSFWTDVWNIFRNYYPQLLQGVGTTMLIALTGTLAGLLIGLLTGVARTAPLSRSSVLRLLQRLLNGLIAACRPTCCNCCQTVDEGNYDLSQVPEQLLAVLMDNDCCKGLLARRLETGETVYGE